MNKNIQIGRTTNFRWSKLAKRSNGYTNRLLSVPLCTDNHCSGITKKKKNSNEFIKINKTQVKFQNKSHFSETKLVQSKKKEKQRNYQ